MMLAATLGAGGVVGLVVADTVVPRLVARLELNARLARGMVRTTEVHAEAFVAFIATLALVGGGVLASALCLRRPALRRLWMVGALAAACAVSIGAGFLAAALLLAVSGVLATQRTVPPAPARDAGGGAGVIDVASVLSGAWGACLARSVSAAVLVGALAIFLAHRRRAQPLAPASEAIAGVPLLFLPLIGMLRAPSPWWVVCAAAVAALMREPVGRFVPRAPTATIGAIAVAASAIAALLAPMRMHELFSANHYHHEAHHLAWIQSALDGKLFMADAATVYPPLREYLLVAWALATGVTAEHVRAALFLVNVLFLPALLLAGWHLAGRRADLYSWYAFALVACTPLRVFLDYEQRISFGQADVGRIAVPALVVVMGTSDLHRPRRALSWGLAAGLSILYSQEFALCSIAAVVGARVAGAAIGRGRALRSTRASLARFAAGAALPLVLLTCAYAIVGKAGTMLRTMFRWMLLAGVGAVQATPFPASFGDLEHPHSFFSAFGVDWSPAAYLVAPLVYVVAAISLVLPALRRRWSERFTVRLALTIFGLTTFRVPLQRADYYHLLSALLPAALLLVDLSADALSMRRRALPKICICAAALLTVCIANADGAFTTRLERVFRGVEAPSRGAPYRHDGVPRAGDIRFDEPTAALVRFISQNIPPSAPIFCALDPFWGEEVYFLADRRNPTRFDALVEITTPSDRSDALAALRRDPPALVLATGRPVDELGPDIQRLIDEEYEEIASFGVVRARAPKQARSPQL
jgi:hypothetical protein